MLVDERMANGRSPEDDKEEAEYGGHDEGEAIDAENGAGHGGQDRRNRRPARRRAILKTIAKEVSRPSAIP